MLDEPGPEPGRYPSRRNISHLPLSADPAAVPTLETT